MADPFTKCLVDVVYGKRLHLIMQFAFQGLAFLLLDIQIGVATAGQGGSVSRTAIFSGLGGTKSMVIGEDTIKNR